ncbi:MAG: cysteine desulfurase family protein [Bdellovibrionales bacterium]
MKITPQSPIYLDHQSTTPSDPQVVEAMVPFLTENFGNASSNTHSYGWIAKEAVEEARKQVALAIQAQEREIIFTSGATESISMAVLGVALNHNFQGHIITTNVEHRAVLEACKAVEKRGVKLTVLPADQNGQVTAAQVEAALTPETILVSIIYANNEIGTINPISEIGSLCRRKDIPFHVDGTQAVGKLALSVDEDGVSLMSFSAHKIYGPKGVGALFARKRSPRVKLDPLISGGGQELGMRGGTYNVAGIVGFGKACEIAMNQRITECTKMLELRTSFLRILSENVLGFRLNGHSTQRLCNNLSLTFEGAKSVDILGKIHKVVALSTGSSCSSLTGDPSHVLMALGLSKAEALSTVRIGFGRFNTSSQIETAAKELAQAVKNARTKAAPLKAPKDLHLST